jgi:hypothetical protein
MEFLNNQKMRYSWDECKLYVIDRLSWKIQGQVKHGVLESRDHFVEQASCLAHSYFRYKRCREVPQIQGSEEWEQIWPDIERIMDKQLENGRRKCIEKAVISTSMKAVLEPRLKESGLDYSAKYNKKSVDVRIKVSGTRTLEVNIKYEDLQGAVDCLINTAKALQTLTHCAGENIGLPKM